MDNKFYDDADISLVIAQTACTKEEAIEHLVDNNGDLLSTILSITEYLEKINQIERKGHCTKQEAIDAFKMNDLNVSYAIFAINSRNIKG